MANEIYSKSWWGKGACNSIGWGIVYKEYAGCNTPIVTSYILRVEADGGTLESIECIPF
tara:strand:- start:1516 stop:1692 length:177 start_codon:yes stop_codon:yes gene_type:complete